MRFLTDVRNDVVKLKYILLFFSLKIIRLSVRKLLTDVRNDVVKLKYVLLFFCQKKHPFIGKAGIGTNLLEVPLVGVV
jgi:hypothetical protein